MTKRNNTEIFIEAVKRCLKTTSFEKITVREIVRESGLSRQTFYRTCDSKYDLVNQFLQEIILQAYQGIGMGHTLRSSMEMKFEKMEKERDLFAGAFCSSDDYEGLYHYMHRLVRAFHQSFLTETLEHELDRELETLLDIYCESFVYLTMQWTIKKIEYTPAQMADLSVDAMPLRLRVLYQDYM